SCSDERRLDGATRNERGLSGAGMSVPPLRRLGARMGVTVLVRPKAGIRDPQGEAVEGSLLKLGFPVSSMRVGKVIDFELEAEDADDARKQVERMCEALLANPLIESIEIELEER